MKTTEQTRTRENGTEVTTPKSGLERIAAIKRIVERKQYAKIDGQMIDLFSASLIAQVYDALSEEKKTKYSACSAGKMAHIAFKLNERKK